MVVKYNHMHAAIDSNLVEDIRAASRLMAREWGFMGGSFAGTELPPSAVHALIEIEKADVSARDLSARLHLEKSSVSRMLRKLVASGDVNEDIGAHDSRVKMLSLTAAGRKRVAAIHAHARAQVADALERLKPGQDRAVLKGLRLYTVALGAQTEVRRPLGTVVLQSGFRPGLIGRITQMHAMFYAREVGFGQCFESVVAGGLAEFCGRLDKPVNGIWAAIHGGEVAGSVALDGEDLGSGVAHLRWFIVNDSIRGRGAGRKLLGAALAQADDQGFAETHLWTFSGLSAARHLYESHGFVCVEERPGDQWGREVMEQRFVRTRP